MPESIQNSSRPPHGIGNFRIERIAVEGLCREGDRQLPWRSAGLLEERTLGYGRLMRISDGRALEHVEHRRGIAHGTGYGEMGGHAGIRIRTSGPIAHAASGGLQT